MAKIRAWPTSQQIANPPHTQTRPQDRLAWNAEAAVGEYKALQGRIERLEASSAQLKREKKALLSTFEQSAQALHARRSALALSAAQRHGQIVSNAELKLEHLAKRVEGTLAKQKERQKKLRELVLQASLDLKNMDGDF